MAEKEVPEFCRKQVYTFKNVQLFKNETLGTGSYGAVCKAKCDQLICAAKLLYPVLFQLQATDSINDHRQPFHRFESECQFLSDISHPNIVQYLGTHLDSDTNALVLLMELMDESLTHFLETSLENISFDVQVNLANDIAQALAFLHANGIIHRDLSSNNVLLLAGRAKVTDFGMLKFVNVNASRFATMTTCPGTPVFMPPEALNEPPLYTEKLDTFSFGVLLVQIVTLLFPKPTDRFQSITIPDPRKPSHSIQAQIAIPETERREAHISLIESTHPFLPFVFSCLEDDEDKRPPSKQLCEAFSSMKQLDLYTKSSHQKLKDEQINLLREEIKVKNEEAKKVREEMMSREQSLCLKNAEIEEKDKHISVQLNTIKEMSRHQNEKFAMYDQKIKESVQQVENQECIIQEKNTQIAEEISKCKARENQIHDMGKEIRSLKAHIDHMQSKIKDCATSYHDYGLQEKAEEILLHKENELADVFPQANTVDSSENDKPVTVVDIENENGVFFKLKGEELNRLLKLSSQKCFALEEEIQVKNAEIVRLIRQIESIDNTIVSHLEKISEQDQIIQNFKYKFACKEEEIHILTTQVHQLEGRLSKKDSVPLGFHEHLQLAWGTLPRAPVIMWAGSATVISEVAYFWPDWGQIIHQFNANDKQWSTLPVHPLTNFAIVGIDNYLTTVGGLVHGRPSNKLFTMISKKWIERFPSMPTQRAAPAVICAPNTLIVAGGRDGRNISLSSIEILNVASRQWSSVRSLPFAPSKLSISLHNDIIYIATEATASEGEKFVVLKVSLESLESHNLSLVQWENITSLPVRNTSLVNLNGHLLAIGGKDSIGSRNKGVYKYHPSNDSWQLISHMSTARDSCLTVVLPGSKLMIVGGYEQKVRRNIEIAINNEK